MHTESAPSFDSLLHVIPNFLFFFFFYQEIHSYIPAWSDSQLGLVLNMHSYAII
jgi:hypothetical protein